LQREDVADAEQVADDERVTWELVPGIGHSIQREAPDVVLRAVHEVVGGR
jgi:pimeloyl-ACP methyl ester carboxylesterase